MNERRKPCGLHCIKINQFGVTMGGQVIIEEVSLHIHCGRLTAVIGRNGAGKSTLIKAVLGEIPHTGTIEFKDHEDGEFQHLKIGYVPQKVNIDKNTPTSVYDLIASFDCSTPVFLIKSKKEYQKIKEQLSFFDAEELIDKQVCNLSGGELQRVLLSLATISTPNLLILDEPVSGIDQNGMELFYRNIDQLKKNYDLAIILISHDLDYVARYADEVILLDKKILKEGTINEVYASKEFATVFGEVKLLSEDQSCS